MKFVICNQSHVNLLEWIALGCGAWSWDQCKTCEGSYLLLQLCPPMNLLEILLKLIWNVGTEIYFDQVRSFMVW